MIQHTHTVHSLVSWAQHGEHYRRYPHNIMRAAARRKSKSAAKPRPSAAVDPTTAHAPDREPASSGSTDGRPSPTDAANLTVDVEVALDGQGDGHGWVQESTGIDIERHTIVQTAETVQDLAQGPEKQTQMPSEVRR